jgi:hypothetical protein
MLVRACRPQARQIRQMNRWWPRAGAGVQGHASHETMNDPGWYGWPWLHWSGMACRCVRAATGVACMGQAPIATTPLLRRVTTWHKSDKNPAVLPWSYVSRRSCRPLLEGGLAAPKAEPGPALLCLPHSRPFLVSGPLRPPKLVPLAPRRAATVRPVREKTVRDRRAPSSPGPGRRAALPPIGLTAADPSPEE